MLELYNKLVKGKRIRKEEEAEFYGVDVKSIERDLNVIKAFLSEQKAETEEISEVKCDRKRGEYYLLTTTRSEFTKSEILAISKILLKSRAFTKNEMNELILNEQFHYVEPHHKTVFIDKI